MNLVKTGRLIFQFVRHNSPIILSAAAGVGLVALYILTIKETEEAVQEINEAPEEEVHSFKMAKKVVKIMAPSFVVLVFTLFCIVQSCMISQHRIRDLTQYSAMLAATFNQYRQKNRELLGPDGPENNDKMIMGQIAAEQKVDKKLPELEEGILCQMIGYPNYFTVPNVAFIYTAILKANKYMETGRGSVELSQWFKWAHAVEYDEKGRVRGMNLNYLHYGWDTYDLQADRSVNVGALYPCVEVVGDDSGLEIYLIDLPAPKPLDVDWNYGNWNYSI